MMSANSSRPSWDRVVRLDNRRGSLRHLVGELAESAAEAAEKG